MTKNFNFYLIFILIPFVLSKILFISFLGYGNGIPFGGMHHPDYTLLQNDLYETMKFWHYSPPLINFILGILLKLFNGNLILIDKIYFFYNLFLSFLIITIGYYFCLFFKISKTKTIILSLFLVLNPNLIFYENFSRPVYSHTVACLFAIICFFSYKYFYTKKDKYIFLLYFTLCLLTYTWTLFHPLLLIIVTFFLFFFIKIKNKFFITTAIVFILISLLPLLKNKIIFNFFGGGSHMWIQIAQSIPGHRAGCLQPIKDIIRSERLSFAPTPDKLSKLHQSMKEKPVYEEENHLNLNHVAYLRNIDSCKNWFIETILKDPFLYPRKRIESLVASHSKFAFEFNVGSPDILKEFFKYKDKNILKKSKQILILLYMLSLYLLIFYLILFTKDKKLKNFLSTIMLVYFYLLGIGHLFNGYEQERMLYGGFFIHFLFFLLLNKRLIMIKKNEY